MATYNGERYLAEQLDSILNQSYKDIYITIRDDGSNDNTIAIVKKYIQANPNKIRLVEDNVKCGSSKANFMQALKHTNGDYIMFSDQDDVWLPDKIKHTLDRMVEIEKKGGANLPVLVFGSYKPVNDRLNDIKVNKKKCQEASYKLAFSNLIVQNYVNGCLMMINRTLANLMGEYDDAILMHDWWAALIASGGGTIEHIDEVMMLYRQHGGNVVGSVNVKSLRYRIKKILDSETKNANKYYLRQAELLEKRNFDILTQENKKVLENFVNLFTKNKLTRMKKLVKGNYLKSDLVRILGQLFYI